LFDFETILMAEMGSSASTVPEELKTEIAAREAKGILTASAPGAWAGKEGKHVPLCEVKDGKATVTVNGHGMEEAHWMDYIYAKDSESGALIGAVKLAYTDAPHATFDIPAGTKKVVGFNSCNLHGTWATDATPVA
jgi:desulfoferrodoxin (superoxide reductase-like protein)